MPKSFLELVPRSATHLRPSAVTWIDDRHAIVAVTTSDDRVDLGEVVNDRPDEPYLARVADRIGDRERVLILGPNTMRTALEREYVTIFHRPDRIIDVEPSAPPDRDEMVARLLTLAS